MIHSKQLMERKEKSLEQGWAPAHPRRDTPLPLACSAPLDPRREKGVRRCEPQPTTRWGSTTLDLAAVFRLLSGTDPSPHFSGLGSKEDITKCLCFTSIRGGSDRKAMARGLNGFAALACFGQFWSSAFGSSAYGGSSRCYFGCLEARSLSTVFLGEVL